MNLNRPIFAAVIGLTLLLVIPFDPAMPAAGLDPSWTSALNDAISRGLVFGRDIVFTFGPLGPVYTGVYHPMTDDIMLVSSAIVASGMVAGFWLVSRPHLWMALGLPLALSLSALRDPAFMAIPLLLLLAAARTRDERGSAIYVAFGAIGAAIGMLPLIKGSFSGVVGIEALLAFVMLLGSGRRDLASLITITSATALILSWMATGQPLMALPGFFIAQAPIISGYSGAMSLYGKFWIVAWFACMAGLLLLAIALGLQLGLWKRIAVLLGLPFFCLFRSKPPLSGTTAMPYWPPALPVFWGCSGLYH
ncbi:hypothetical protein AWV80_15740 [Cupriavidus sp. UYMU48A]|nr:hypothetical protein AWV80_15740 [Cupriavidus sp. UYMU48A]